MGGARSAIATDDWNPSDWEPLPAPHPYDYNRAQTLRSRRTGALTDEYQVFWANRGEYEYYLKSYYWRHAKHNLTPVVASMHLHLPSQYLLCSSGMVGTVYIEHISLRLSDIDELPLADGLYVMLEALEGYNYLYQHAGYFRIEEEQIGLDRTGRVKVWVNSDYSKNYPETDGMYGTQRKNEVHMVQQLIEMVFASIDKEEHPHHTLM